MQTASHSRYVVIFSSENMTCGPWIALFSAYWASGSLLGILAGSDGLRQVTTYSHGLDHCNVHLLVPFSTCH
jgi:hypothetical protein